MKKTSLVVLAAGMGSRYGGLKQMDPIGPNGEIILELSVFDAIQAGFNEVVFVIKQEIEDDFKRTIGNKIAKMIPVKYVYQELAQIPNRLQVPENRQKPWGTGHAIMCCEGIVDTPFCVINADDYYGQSAYYKMHEFLSHNHDEHTCAMIAYHVNKTISDHGSVSRGICHIENHRLQSIVETCNISRNTNGEACIVDTVGACKQTLPNDTLVSLNMWGFQPQFIKQMGQRFTSFYQHEVIYNPLKAEYFLSDEIGRLIKQNTLTVQVFSSQDTWYGVTYQEDKELVKQGIQSLIDEQKYPTPLWRFA